MIVQHGFFNDVPPGLSLPCTELTAHIAFCKGYQCVCLWPVVKDAIEESLDITCHQVKL